MSGSIQNAASTSPVSPVVQAQGEMLRQAPGPAQSARAAVAPPDSPPPEAVEALERTLRSLTPKLMNTATRLSIDKDAATGTFVYRAIDRETGDVIHQYPGEDMLAVIRFMRDFEGMLVDQRA